MPASSKDTDVMISSFKNYSMTSSLENTENQDVFSCDDENNNINIEITFNAKLASLEEKCKSQDMEIHLLKCGLSDALHRLSSFEQSFLKTNKQLQEKVACNEKLLEQVKENLTESIVANSQFQVSQPANSQSQVKPRPRSKTQEFDHKTKSGVNKKKSNEGLPNGKFPDNKVNGSTNQKVKVATKKSYSQRTQSAEIAKIDENSTKTETGKPKLILAKKPASPKKRLNSSSNTELSSKRNSGDFSPSDDNVKFTIRGRGMTFYVPTDFQEEKDASLPPDVKLQLDWIYGYRGKDCRDNLHLLPDGELVYNMAGTVILYNYKSHIQRHYLEHNDDVKCVAIHPNKKYIASGQVAGHGDDSKPHVRVWDSETLETLSCFGHGNFERSVTCVEFFDMNESGYLIVLDEINVVYIYEWQKSRLVTEAKGSKDPILGVKYNMKNHLSFVTYGKSHLAMWKIIPDESSQKFAISKKMAIYDKVNKPKFALCVCFVEDGGIMSGDSNGNIVYYSKDSNHPSRSALQAHKGGVMRLEYYEGRDIVLSFGRHGDVSSWNTNLEKIQDFDGFDDQFGFAKDVVWCQEEKKYFIGTSKNCIINLDEGLSTSSLVAQGHHDEMWGLATHPTKEIFATCAQEQLVCIWDSETKKNLWSYYIDDKAKVAEFHPTKDYVIIGTFNGKLYFLDYESKEELLILPVSRDCIDDIKISPDENFIAVASRDTNIYLYRLPSDELSFKKAKVLQGHSSRVLHLDWSSDSEFLQSNSGDYEVLYWQAESGLQVLSAAALRDVEWATWTCPFGFSSMGIWPEGADGTDINACVRSPDKSLIATGDDFGSVKLFRYPSYRLKSDGHTGVGHSSHVTCVRFLCKDNTLITVGGQDCSVMQWKTVPFIKNGDADESNLSR